MLPTSISKEVKGISAYEWANEFDLNWEAEKTPLHYWDNNGVGRDSSMVAITRSDTGQELGVVSPKYQIVQPQSILEGFEEAVHNLGAGFEMDGIGLYDNGRIIWGRAKSDHSITIQGTDHIDSYLYMITSFDGSTSTMGFVSTLRTICSNALHLAQKKGDSLFNLSHRSKYKGQAKSALDTYMNTLNEFESNANLLANKRVNADQAIDWMNNLLYSGKELSDRNQTTVDTYLRESVQGKGHELASVGIGEGKISMWGLLNGVTSIVDHNPIRKSGTEEVQAKSRFIGAGNTLKNKAFKSALKMAA